MNKSILFVLLFFASSQVVAQEQTLITGKVEHGGFGGPVVNISQVREEMAVFVGGRGGWIINHMFSIGGGGYGMVTEVNAPEEADKHYGRELNINFGYGGFVSEFIVNSDNLIHYTLSALIGAGGVTYTEDIEGEGQEEKAFDKSDAVFVFEPAIHGELNVTEWFRINAGISYRVISGLDLYELNKSDLGGPAIQITFKFGTF